MVFCETLPFAGNINFNAQHSPMGAFMSFTCGHFHTGGGIGTEIGKPAGQNLYIGVKDGRRNHSSPFGACRSSSPAPNCMRPAFPTKLIKRSRPRRTSPLQTLPCRPNSPLLRVGYGFLADLRTLSSPFTPRSLRFQNPMLIPKSLKSCLLPAVIATLEVDNRDGADTKTARFRYRLHQSRRPRPRI